MGLHYLWKEIARNNPESAEHPLNQKRIHQEPSSRGIYFFHHLKCREWKVHRKSSEKQHHNFLVPNESLQPSLHANRNVHKSDEHPFSLWFLLIFPRLC